MSARPKGARRRRLRMTIALTSLLVVVLLCVASVRIVLARNSLLSAAHEAETASFLISRPGGLQNGGARSKLEIVVSRARSDFAAAHDDLWPWAGGLEHLQWVPLVGPQLAGAFPIADAGLHASTAGLELLAGLHPLWAVLSRKGPHVPLLARLTGPLSKGQAAFRESSVNLGLAARDLRHIPEDIGNPTLNTRIATFRHELPGIRSSSQWLAVSPGLLGRNGASHYLIAWQDRREIRATGGFIGAADYVTIRNGYVTTVPTGSSLAHERMVPLPAPEGMYTAEGSWLFRDANFSPNFPLSGRVERWMYGEDTGHWAPFVINVLDGAGDILRATGPVEVPGYNRTVTARNAQSVAVHYIYQTEHSGTGGAAYDADRVRFLGAFTSALISRIQTLDLAQLLSLGSTLHQAVDAQHVEMYAREPAVQEAVRLAGAGGRIARPAHDSLYIVDDNRSYNKLNPYVRESASYEVVIHRNLWADARLRVTYHVNPSPSSLEGFGPFFGGGGSKHDYLDFVRVFVPPGTHVINSAGGNGWSPEPAYGLTQMAQGVFIPEGASKRLSFHYRIPPTVFSDSRYALSVQRQPGSDLASISIHVKSDPGIALVPQSGPIGHSYTRTLTLGGRLSTLTVGLVGHLHPAIPPDSQTSRQPDPFIRQGLFHDPHHRF